MSAIVERALGLLDAQIAAACAARLRGVEEYLHPEAGRRHQTFFTTDVRGLVQVQADAAFVAETLIWTPSWTGLTLNAGLVPNSCVYTVTIEDLSAGRLFTEGRRPPGALVSTDPSPVLVEDALVDGNALGSFTTYSGDASSYRLPAPDEWFKFPSALLIPRSATLRFRTVPEWAGGYRFTLGGYKLMPK